MSALCWCIGWVWVWGPREDTNDTQFDSRMEAPRVRGRHGVHMIVLGLHFWWLAGAVWGMVGGVGVLAFWWMCCGWGWLSCLVALLRRPLGVRAVAPRVGCESMSVWIAVWRAGVCCGAYGVPLDDFF